MRSKNREIMNEIVSYIDDVFFNSSRVPSIREIADNVKISKSTVCDYIAFMVQEGMLEKSSGHYGIVTPAIKKAKGLRNLPVVGSIACGTPILAEQNIETYLTISGDFLGSGEHFVLVAKGDSMINVGIDDGDYVIVRKQNTANEGQIVVALIDNEEATLKRFYLDKKRRKVRLHPENDNMKDMYYNTIDIQGIAIKVIKNID